MPARRRVLCGAGSLLAAVAGCVSAPGATNRPAASTPDATTAQATTATTTESTTAETADSTTSTADPYATETAPWNRLVIEATGDLTLTVTKYRSSDAEHEIASKTYDLADGSEVHVTAFDPEGYVVFTLDGETVWEGAIGPDGRYQFTVGPNGYVDLTYSIK